MNRLEWVRHPHGFWELWDTWTYQVISTCHDSLSLHFNNIVPVDNLVFTSSPTTCTPINELTQITSCHEPTSCDTYGCVEPVFNHNNVVDSPHNPICKATVKMLNILGTKV